VGEVKKIDEKGCEKVKGKTTPIAEISNGLFCWFEAQHPQPTGGRGKGRKAKPLGGSNYGWFVRPKKKVRPWVGFENYPAN